MGRAHDGTGTGRHNRSWFAWTDDSTDWLDVNWSGAAGCWWLLLGIRRPRTLGGLLGCVVDAVWH